MTKHRFPPYVLDVIKATVVKDMVEGEYGHVPGNGISGKRNPDGGFYKRIQTDVENKYGHTIGQGTINKCREKALPFITSVNPPSVRAAPSVADQLKKLNTKKTFSILSSDQQGLVRSMQAYKKCAALKPSQVEIIKDMFKKYCSFLP